MGRHLTLPRHEGVDDESHPGGLSRGEARDDEAPVARERHERNDHAGRGGGAEKRVSQRPSSRQPRCDDAREHGDGAGEREGQPDADLVEAVLFAEDVEKQRLDALLTEVRDEHQYEQPSEDPVLKNEPEALAHLRRDHPQGDLRSRSVQVVDRRHQEEHEKRGNERE